MFDASKSTKGNPPVCKYGNKCYQKNPLHLEKYKHPKKRQSCDSDSGDENTSKKTKFEENTNISTINEKLKVFIKEKFLLEMPQDFYDFWTFCCEINNKTPLQALNSIGLTLVGPFDVLTGKFETIEKTQDEYLRHWRYYYDPPEFQTVIKGDDKNGFHIGYFRDDPAQLPSLVVGNNGVKDGVLVTLGDNIFAGVYNFLEDLKKTGDPFKKMHIPKIQNLIKAKADKLELSLARKSQKILQRQSKTVTRTFNKIGLIVPFDKKTKLGYRELCMSDKELCNLLNNIEKSVGEERNVFLSKLQTVLTNVSIALDECDFGTGIELGWDIIAHGVGCLNNTAERFLVQAYGFLGRDVFAKIAQAHLKNRKKDCHLSIL